METIVVGIDQTPASRSALDWVSARCARHPSRVQIVNVVGRFTRDRSGSSELLSDAERALRERVPGQRVELFRLEGSPAHELTDLARDADLLVIGIDPEHPLAAALGGWLPVRVAALSTVPLCVVPAGWTEGDGDIAVGLADDSSSAQALVQAAEEALALGKTLHVVHAWREADMGEDGPAALLSEPEAEIFHHRAFLNDAVMGLQERFPRLHVESDLVRATPQEALVRGAEGSMLIVIGTHHLGVFAGGFSGSIARDVLWETHSPVCIVPPVPA